MDIQFKGQTFSVDVDSQTNTITPESADAIASQLGAMIGTQFSDKTLYQENSSRVSEGDYVLSFAAKFGSTAPVMKLGKYAEYKVQYVPAGVKFNRESFIPSQLNVGASDSSIRREVNNIWLGYKLTFPAFVDNNIYMNRLDYLYTEFVESLLTSGSQFIEDSFNELMVSLQYHIAGKILSSTDYQMDIDKAGTQGTFKSIGGLLVDAKNGQTAGISGIPTDADMLSTSNASRWIVSSATDRIAAYRDLNVLLFKMQNNNTFFSYDNEGNFTANRVIQHMNASNMVLIANANTVESIKASNLNFYKDIAIVINAGNLLTAPITGFNTNYREPTAGISDPVAELQVNNLGLADGQILIVDKSKYLTFGYFLAGQSSETFKNNMTRSDWVKALVWTHYKYDGAVCLFDAPILTQDFAIVTKSN